MYNLPNVCASAPVALQIFVPLCLLASVKVRELGGGKGRRMGERVC